MTIKFLGNKLYFYENKQERSFNFIFTNKDTNQHVDKDAESLLMYNESNNDILNNFMFGDTLEKNIDIINNQIDNKKF